MKNNPQKDNKYLYKFCYLKILYPNLHYELILVLKNVHGCNNINKQTYFSFRTES